MYRTVVVPLDGSDLSERAVPFGRALADAAHAHLILMRVVPPAEYFDARDPAVQAKEMRDAEAYVQGFVVRSEADSSGEGLTYFGNPANLIVDETRARPSPLIVMSTHGRSGVSELVYGSVAEEVIRRTAVPVLVIPPGCQQPWPAEHPGRILVTLDGSKLSEAILPEALELARALRANVTLLRVVAATTFIQVEDYPDPVEVPTEGISAVDAERYLNDVASNLPRDGRPVTIDVSEGIDAASQIVLTAKDQATALIAMATHGRGGLAELVLGSVTSKVVKQATVPVLLLRPLALR